MDFNHGSRLVTIEQRIAGRWPQTQPPASDDEHMARVAYWADRVEYAHTTGRAPVEEELYELAAATKHWLLAIMEERAR